MELFAIPALDSNYIWLVVNSNKETIIIDPGVSDVVIDFINQHDLKPKAILLTHHHLDHIAGVTQLDKRYPKIKIYAPSEVLVALPHLSMKIQKIDHRQSVTLLGKIWKIIATPGHTLGHVCYYTEPYLFCGDTLFSGGCGRVFEGTASQLYRSLVKLAHLPNNTLVCAAHEYTLNNLKFAVTQLPNYAPLQEQLLKTEQLRQAQLITLPSNLGLEKKINIFMLCQQPKFYQKFLVNNKILSPIELFSYFRKLKDNY